MASKLKHIASLSLALILSFPAQAQDNNQNQLDEQPAAAVSEEIIVVAPKADAQSALQLAMQPGITDPQDLILQNLAERLSSAEQTPSKSQLDI